MRNVIIAACGLVGLTACATAQQTQALYGDLNAALIVARAAEGAYAGMPGADAAVVAKLSQLTIAAQAAMAALQANPGSPVAQSAAQAAVAGLSSYLAQQAPTKLLAARAPGA
jgi:hypothetical protein